MLIRTAALVLALCPISFAQTTWYVNASSGPGGNGSAGAPFDQIQDAVQVSVSGDTILVLPGTYVETVTIQGLAVTLVSDVDGDAATYDPDPNLVWIDADASGAAVRLLAGNVEPDDAVLDGFGIRGGLGAGVDISGSDYGFTPTVQNCRIESNDGPGVYAEFSAPLIQRNTIRFNTNAWFGGGISTDFAGSIILDNVITDNTAQSGGGISTRTSCTCPTIARNLIQNNTGGGLHTFEEDPMLEGNWIVDNLGDGVLAVDVDATLLSNTIAGNTGVGLAALDGRLDVSQTIFWANAGLEITMDQIDYGCWLDIDHSLIDGGKSAVGGSGGSCTVNWGAVILDRNPKFADVASGDYHLTRGSPAINRGPQGAAPGTDLDGESRPFMGTHDLGADEYTGPHRLAADGFVLDSSAGGGVITLTLDAGATHAGRPYLVFGGFSGSVPGIAMPSGGALPVNWDLMTSLLLSLSAQGHPGVVGFVGNLDGQGQATAQFDTLGQLPPTATGLTFTFAYSLRQPWDFESTPVHVQVQ